MGDSVGGGGARATGRGAISARTFSRGTSVTFPAGSGTAPGRVRTGTIGRPPRAGERALTVNISGGRTARIGLGDLSVRG